MKRRIYFLIFCFIVSCCMVFLLASCSQSTKIELPFVAEDVSSVEIYHYKTPSQAQQKQITSPQDIASLIETLTTIPVTKNRLPSHKPGTITSFRFNLTDGTDFEVIYTGYGVKKGTIQSSYVFDYQTISDIGSIWNNFDSPITTPPENILPVYDQ